MAKIVVMPKLGLTMTEGTVSKWLKKVGDEVSFGGLLGCAPVIKLNSGSPAKFVNRGGRVPAPIHSLKN